MRIQRRAMSAGIIGSVLLAVSFSLWFVAMHKRHYNGSFGDRARKMKYKAAHAMKNAWGNLEDVMD